MRPDMIGPRRLRPANNGSFGEPLFQMTQEDPHRVLKGTVLPSTVQGQVNGVMPGVSAPPKPQPELWVLEKAYENAGPAKVGLGEPHFPGRPITRKSRSEVIPGGKSSGKPEARYDPKAVARGKKIEMEHVEGGSFSSGKKRRAAEEISRDHLEEHPGYYDEDEGLPKMERKLKEMGKAFDDLEGTSKKTFKMVVPVDIEAANPRAVAKKTLRSMKDTLTGWDPAKDLDVNAKVTTHDPRICKKDLGKSLDELMAKSEEHEKEEEREPKIKTAGPAEQQVESIKVKIKMKKAKEEKPEGWMPPTEYGPEAYGKPAHPKGHGMFSGEPIEKIKTKLGKYSPSHDKPSD